MTSYDLKPCLFNHFQVQVCINVIMDYIQLCTACTSTKLYNFKKVDVYFFLKMSSKHFKKQLLWRYAKRRSYV